MNLARLRLEVHYASVDIEYKIDYHKSDNGEESRIVLNDR